MATTTNYGWTTPDDTALVKDGAAAIRTLGSSIDTSVKSLNAGTTAGDLDYYTSATAKTRVAIGTSGQSLTVVGGVPAWAASPTSVLTAKGDVLTATAANTIARLGVGANDTVLTADSTAATGLKWAAPASGGMTLISTTTLTGASVTLSSIPSTYNSLEIVIQNWRPATNAANLYMRINSDSGANRYRSITAVSGAAQSFSNTEFTLSQTTNNGASTGLTQVTVPNYANAITWKMIRIQSIVNDDVTSTNFGYYNAIGGYYNQTTAISSLNIFPSSGNFTSGTVLLYGVK